MSQTLLVISNQRRLFLRDKGMLLFYAGSIAALGIVFPILFDSSVSGLTLITFMTVTLQKQWASDSVAGERENRTLEALLSTPLNTKAVLFGKAAFNFLCGTVYYVLILVYFLTTRYLRGTENGLSPLVWTIYEGGALCLLVLTALYGTLCSAKAANVRQAGTRPTMVCYLFTLLLVVVLAVLNTGETPTDEVVNVVAALFFTAIGGTILYSVVKLLRLSRPGITEAERPARGKQVRAGEALFSAAHTRMGSVFAHEWRYFRTLKGLILQFCVLAVCPAIVLFLGWYYLGRNDLYYAVLLTILIIPRIPANLVAYSVGGEKAYRTGESILSTPVSVTALFWGKAAVPLMVCGVMLLLSSALNLLAANLIAGWMGETGFVFYDAGQLVLLFGVGLGVCASMILTAAILSLKAKNPRMGLYLSTILGIGFIIPALAVVYLTQSKLIGAAIYLALLLVFCIVMYKKIQGASRQVLMECLR